jgi:hypothetical protein
MALERRLQNEAQESGLTLDRLRRRVVFQRIVTRLQRSEPGRWVLKGGMALEVRLGDDARLTRTSTWACATTCPTRPTCATV